MAAKSSGEMPNNRYIRKCPNGETPLSFGSDRAHARSAPREVKHLSTWRNRKQIRELSFWLDGPLADCHYNQEEGSRDSLSSGERNGTSPNRSCLHGRGCRAVASLS